MSILGDAKSYYVKNSGVNSVMHYLHLNEYSENEFLDFSSPKNNYLQIFIYLIFDL